MPAHSPEYIDAKRLQGHGMSNLNDVLCGSDPVKLLPTPLAGDASGSRGSKGKDRPNEGGLLKSLMMFPTPCACSGDQGVNEPDGKRGQTLLGAAMMQVWSTPRASSKSGGGIGLDGGAGARQSPTPPELRTGQLNPDWEEWFMGWPPGWTSLAPLDRATFNAWRDVTANKGPWWASEPAGIPRLASKVPNRIARCRAIGNGQVPAAVVLAWRTLIAIVEAPTTPMPSTPSR